MTIKSKLLILTLSASLSLMSCTTGAVTTEELMNLNRQGRWSEARKSALTMLEKTDESPREDLGQIYYNLAYAEVRLGDHEKGKEILTTLKKLIDEQGLPPEDLWVKRETEKLISEIHTETSTEKLIRLNGLGRWDEAKEMSLSLLENKEQINHDALCGIYLNLAYADVRLKNPKEGKETLDILKKLIKEKGLSGDYLWVESEMYKLYEEIYSIW